MSSKVETLKVPGATLHVEVAGSGPVLLLIPGPPADSGIFGGIGSILSQKYTTVTFDLRGQVRSPLDGEHAEASAEQYADDAAAVLDKYASGPAKVLGCSMGGIVGLDLAARYPDKVSNLVVHEPPLAGLLPNADAWAGFYEELYQTFQVAGAGAAMGMFIASIDNYLGPEADASKGPPPPPPIPDFAQMSPEEAAFVARMGGNMEVFFPYQIRSVTKYQPDVAALKSASAKVVVAVGEASKGQLPHNAGSTLADKLGVGPVVFPGDHQGFNTHTAAWAEAADKALD